MPTYHKLVRDRIPDIIEHAGKTCRVEQLTAERFRQALADKLTEEISEYQAATTDAEAMEELADILEIMHALTRVYRSSPEQLEIIRQKKADERGGFEKGLFLLEVSDD